MISKNKVGILINMDKEMKQKLEELAKKDGRSTTNYIIQILSKHIQSTNKK